MSLDTIVAGGRVVLPAGVREASVAVDDGRVAAVGDEASLPESDRRIDATGKIVLPGAVDPHVHIDEVRSYAGSYATETAAAALGGVTTIVDFAWQGGDRTLNEDRTLLDGIEHKRERGEDAFVDFGLHGAITREETGVFEEIAPAIERGVTSFKMYMSTYETGISNGFIERTMRELAAHDAVAMVHTEDPSVCEHRRRELEADGKGDPKWYPASRPDFVEAMAAEDALRMASEADVRYYGMHTSCRTAAETIARFQRDRTRVRSETCPHYLVLDESAYESQGTLPVIAPPLRTCEDNEALFEYLRKGVLSVVSTDHVPFRRSEKSREHWWDAPFGTNGIQVSLPLFHDAAVVGRGLSYPVLARVKSELPAETFGLPRKGSLEPGNDADIVVFDPDASITVRADENASAADYSIYEGRTIQGRVEKTLVRGQLVVDDGSVVGEPGDGKFQQRTVPEWQPR